MSAGKSAPLGGWGGLAALMFASAWPAAGAARQAPAAVAPAAWHTYAEAANRQISEWLSAPDERALTLRALIDATRTDPTAPSAPRELKLWIGAEGFIERLGFADLGPEAEAAAGGALLGRRLAPPPRDMPMPLRLAIQLQPDPPSSQASQRSHVDKLGPISRLVELRTRSPHLN